jgi:hypothetical protein
VEWLRLWAHFAQLGRLQRITNVVLDDIRERLHVGPGIGEPCELLHAQVHAHIGIIRLPSQSRIIEWNGSPALQDHTQLLSLLVNGGFHSDAPHLPVWLQCREPADIIALQVSDEHPLLSEQPSRLDLPIHGFDSEAGGLPLLCLVLRLSVPRSWPLRVLFDVEHSRAVCLKWSRVPHNTDITKIKTSTSFNRYFKAK